MRHLNYQAIITIAALFFLLMCASIGFSADKKKTPEKAATVNNTVISYEDFQRRLNFYTQSIQNQNSLTEEKQAKLHSDVLEELINHELLFQESRKQGIKVTDTEVANQLASIKQRAGAQEQFTAMLTKMGYTESQYKTDLLRQTAIRTFIDQKITPTVKVTETDAKKYFDANPNQFKAPERVRARHILFKVESDADDKKKAEAREKLMALKKRIDKGEDFATLAKEHSQCPSAKQGGDLNYFTKTQMVKPFADTAFSLKPKQVSDVVETRFGYHLIKVIDHQQAGTLAFGDVKAKLIQNLRTKGIQEKIRAQVDALRKTAKIEKHVE